MEKRQHRRDRARAASRIVVGGAAHHARGLTDQSSSRGPATNDRRALQRRPLAADKLRRPSKRKRDDRPAHAPRSPLSDGEWERRTRPRQADQAKKLVFALGPTRRSRSLNRKKLSKQQKLRLKGAPTPTLAPAFRRGSAKAIKKLLALQLAHGLDADLEAFASFVSLTPDERAFRRRAFDEIHGLIRRVFPTATVELYGSSSSGMETFRSDLDITVGNLDFSQMRSLDTDDVVSEDDVEDEVEADNKPGTYVVSETDDDSVTGDADEPTFSLNLSIPGVSFNIDTQEATVRPSRPASATTKSPWNPTLRRQKMRQLRALQQILVQHRPQYKIKCLSKAKIPILMIVDNDSGLHIDLGVNREAFHASDHGRTTTLVAELQLALGAPFFSIVVFLKEFLHQFDLDKPFTGGLGSYRLYMMVAYIFTTLFPTPSTTKKRKAQPQETPKPGTVLLKFLEVFGNRQKRGFLSTTTELPVRHGSLMDVVDFQAVFRLDDCVEKFAMAFDIISKKRHLACVVYEETLEAERRECAKRIIQHMEKQEQEQRKDQEPPEEEEEEEDDESSDEEYYL